MKRRSIIIKRPNLLRVLTYTGLLYDRMIFDVCLRQKMVVEINVIMIDCMYLLVNTAPCLPQRPDFE